MYISDPGNYCFVGFVKTSFSFVVVVVVVVVVGSDSLNTTRFDSYSTVDSIHAHFAS